MGFVLRRLLIAVPVVWAVVSLVFCLAQAVPGQAFQDAAGRGATDPAAAEHLRNLFGADRSAAERYVRWLAGIVRGDWGISFSHREPVLRVVRRSIGNTVLLSGLAIVLQFGLGTAAGSLAGRFRGGRLDRAIGWVAATLYSTPSFFLGVGLVWLFALQLGWLPASQMRSVGADDLSVWGRAADAARHLVLPCLALTLPAAAGIAIYVRDEMGSVLSRRFLLAARGRGADGRRLFTRHALRNAVLPLTQLFGLALPGIVGGSTVIEVLFAWPGMGRLAYGAVVSRDEPLVLGCTLVAALAVVLGNLLADLTAAVLDPRSRRAR